MNREDIMTIIEKAKKNGVRADLRDADLRDADLRDADLSGADLRLADLRLADLRLADLRDADLRDADLSGADLSGADLRDANLSGADLFGAKNIASFQGGESNRLCYAVKHEKCVMFQIGCFWGDTQEAVTAIIEKYGENSSYEELINLYTRILENN